MSRCFEGIRMQTHSSRVIVRILKSFSVRFAADFYYYYMNHQQWQQYNKNNNKSLPQQQLVDAQMTSIGQQPDWSMDMGSFIIDIKSTHLVKFEEYSFSNLALHTGSKLYIDLELIEKLMIQRYAFSFLNLEKNTRTVFYAKQITFIDFKGF